MASSARGNQSPEMIDTPFGGKRGAQDFIQGFPKLNKMPRRKVMGCITVFGGTGFIGRHLVPLLLRSRAIVRVAVHHPARIQLPAEPTNAAEIVQADVLDDGAVDAAIAGAEAVFNLVGILTETTRQTYHAIHVEGARRVALAAQRHGVMRLIHISALGASLTSSAISDTTKAEGEEAVRAVFPQGTIVRPSLTYGEDDHFFSRFAAMIRSSPVVPLIGDGTTKFQPVFIDDMTLGLLELLNRSETAGKTYEFGGPQVYSFKVLLELLVIALNRQRVLLPIPFALAEMQAGLLELLPNPPLTRDQVRLLKTDKVVSGLEPTLGDLGVQPRPLEEFLSVFKDKYS
jgi:NADH dehydrogenase